jgi:hypothetical protein
MQLPEVESTPAAFKVLPTLFGEGYAFYSVKKKAFLLCFVIQTSILAVVVLSAMLAVTHRHEIQLKPYH